MSIINQMKPSFNTKQNFNFQGGNITTDAGLFLIAEFMEAFGISSLIKKSFRVEGDFAAREHSNDRLLVQAVLKAIAGYHAQDDADGLRHDPLFASLLGGGLAASQPTESRFYGRMGIAEAKVIEQINQEILEASYLLAPPERFVMDADSTGVQAFGKQHGSAYNGHYGSTGFHPLTIYNGETGDMLAAVNRRGSVYTSRGIVAAIGPLILRLMRKFPHIQRFFRADSGFALPELFELLEALGTKYCIKLKSNAALKGLGYLAVSDLATEGHAAGSYDVYRTFDYQAKSWSKARRVVARITKPAGELLPSRMTFIVSDLELGPEDVFRFYNQRGAAENLIKEAKNGFGLGKLPHRKFESNAAKMQISVLAYTIANTFKRLVLPASLSKQTVQTLRSGLFKIGAKVTSHANQIFVKMSTAFPNRAQVERAFENIQSLKLSL